MVFFLVDRKKALPEPGYSENNLLDFSGDGTGLMHYMIEWRGINMLI